jgi:hypothetical protein
LSSSLPEPLYRAVADVAAQASYLDNSIEFVVTTALFQMINSAEYLTKNLSADRLVGLAEKLLIDRFPDEGELIQATFAEIRQARKDRNEIVHAFWVAGEQPDRAHAVSHRPFRTPRRISRTVEQTQLLAGHFSELSVSLLGWEERLYAERNQAWWTNRKSRFGASPDDSRP